MCIFPLTSVALEVLAALLEDKVPNTRPQSVRRNWALWSPAVFRGLPPPPTTTQHHLPPLATTTYHHHNPPSPTTNDKYNVKVEWLIK